MNDTIKQIQVGKVTYEIEDAASRSDILNLNKKLGNNDANSVVIGTGETTGDKSVVVGSGSAEGANSIVIGNGSAYSENSVAIGANTKAGCKGFYIYSITGPSGGEYDIILSTSQTGYTWNDEADKQYVKWHDGDKISYTNGTRYVLKSTITQVDYDGFDRPKLTISDAPANFSKWQPDPDEPLAHEDYSVVNPYRPEAGIVAFASGSFSVGENNSTTGTNSVALGYNNMAAAEYSYAEGNNNIAKGTASHAEGQETIAAGYAHSEGYLSNAAGSFSHAEGVMTKAEGNYSHAEGGCDRNTKTPIIRTIEGTEYEVFGSYSKGAYSHAENNRTFAYGNHSHAEGQETQSIGQASHAEGYQTRAEGKHSHAEGSNTKANGNYSHSEGWETAAHEYSCHAEGCATSAIGESSHAEGQNCKAFGNESHAEGYETISYGDESHAEGYGTIAFGNASHAEGGQSLWVSITGKNKTYNLSTNATSIKVGQIIRYNDIYATITEYNRTSSSIKVDKVLSETDITNQNAIILRPTASGEYSHAEGYCTVASGASSHAEGYQNRATGNYSHAEGTNTIASGIQSHAEGHDAQAIGDSSHAQNKSTIAFDYASTAIGSFNQYWNDHIVNEFDAGNDLFIIGNGTSSNARSNAFRVDFSGNVYTANSSMSTGADYAEYFEWSDGNPEAADRVGRFVSLDNGNQIKLASSSDEILGVISGHAAILGDAYEDAWNGMYERDIYGRLQYEEVEVEYEEEDEEGNITTRTAIETHIKLNPNYDPTQTYVPRSERPEWAPVGLLGKLVVIDDGSCVPGGKCSCGINGTATASATGYYVLKRLDDTHIQILLK